METLGSLSPINVSRLCGSPLQLTGLLLVLGRFDVRLSTRQRSCDALCGYASALILVTVIAAVESVAFVVAPDEC